MTTNARTVLVEEPWNRWKILVECAICGQGYSQALPPQRFQTHRQYLRSLGWKRWKVGWACPTCTQPLGITPRQAQLLRMWVERGAWKPVEFSKRMGVTHRMVQYLREALVIKGYATPGPKPKLNLRRTG